MINIKKIIIIILLSFFCFLNAWAGIKDGLFATVGNKAITKSDIVQEMKIILILNGESYSEENKERIRSAAIKSLIKRIIKQIEIEKYDFLKFNELDVYKEVDRVSKLRGIDSETLRNIFTSNDMDFSLVTKQIETELLWNSLIFEIYKERLSINVDEIEEQLKLIQNAEEIYEYLISEIIIKPLDQNNIETEIKNLEIEFSAANDRDLEFYSSMIFSIDVKIKSRLHNFIRGGRYDELTSNLGFKKIPAVGAAININLL